MIPGPFKRFIAVDWSGAKTAYAKKLCVALCERGQSAPQLIEPDGGWSRQSVAEFVSRQPEGTLTGFDFSFAPPFMDKASYLPGDAGPTTGPAFWSHVEEICQDDKDCGAHSFIEGRYRKYFYLGKADGVKSDFMRWRCCEAFFNAAGGGKAACIFDAIGAAQVCKASFAGMRVLHRLHQGGLAIWPFVELEPGASVAVELYCRAFIQRAGLPGGKVRDVAALNQALAGLGSAPFESVGTLSDDQTDALIACAGLRALAQNQSAWHPAPLTPQISQSEGWTFGLF